MTAIERYYEFADFRLDAVEGVLHKNGEAIVLSPKVFELLLLFLQSDGRVLSHEEIMQTVWADVHVDQANLKQSIYVLRKILGDSLIKTLPKRGYRFLAPVSALNENHEILAAEYTVTDVSIEEEIIEDEPNAPKLLPQDVFKSEKNRLFSLAFCALVFLLAAIGYGVYFYLNQRAAAPSFENISWRNLTDSGNVKFAVLSPNGQFVAFVAIEENGYQSLKLLNIADRSEITIVPLAYADYWGVTFTNDSSQIYYTIFEGAGAGGIGKLYRISIIGGIPHKVLEKINGAVSFSPDATRFAFMRFSASPNQVALMTANADDGSDEQIIVASSDSFALINPSWSPDGKKFLFISYEKRQDGTYWHLAEIPATGGERKIITEPRKGRIFTAVWTDGGKRIVISAIAPEANRTQLWDVSYPDGKIERITNDLNNYFLGSPSADGKMIVTTKHSGLTNIWVWDGAQSTPRKIYGGTSGSLSLSWMPDNRIVFDLHDAKAHLWVMNADGANRQQITPEQFGGTYPHISPDGRYIVFLSNRSGGWQIWRTNSEGNQPQQLTFGNESTAHARFALDGSQVIFKRYFNGRWSLAQIPSSGGEPVSLTENLEVWDWNVSPDGKWLAFSFIEGQNKKMRVAVQSLEDGTAISYLDFTPHDFLAFTPDGKALLTKQMSGEKDAHSTIWQFPVDGGKPQKLLTNPPDSIYWAEYSRDGKQLAFIQGKSVSNVVLLTHSQQ